MKKFKTAVVWVFFFAGLTTLASAQNDHYPQYIDMGNKALAGEKYDLALEYYNSAIDDNPDCWQAYVGLGNCYYYLKKYKDSLKNYEKAMKMDPDNGELVKFVQFLRTKVAPAVLPTPTPTAAPAMPGGLPPLPPPGSALPPPR